MIPPTPFIEALENRIAPALFFVGTATTGDNALAVHKGDALAGTTTAETDAKTAAGSTLAVLLSKGDTLIFDANNNHAQDAGDTVLMKVTNGQTMVFLTDSAAGATAGAFDKNEISGLAVSDKFKAQVFTDINGSVATALNGAGGFTANGTTLNLEHTSIGEFKSSGQVVGNVFAGGSVSKVSVGEALFNVGTTAISIDGNLATGTAASGATVAFGATAFTVNFQINAGENGGSISGVTLAKGVRGIFAGGGGESETGAGGAGGSVSKVTVAESPVGFGIFTGNGEQGFIKGGAGGSISDVSIKSTAVTGGWAFTTGNGEAASKFKGAGGAGGSISSVTLEVAAVNGALEVASGDGGNSPTGKAGAGGAINGFTFINNGAVSGQLTIASGDGGDLSSADGRGNRAADSGAVSKIAIHNRGGLAGFDISSGQGGQLTGGQGSGGNSGAVSGITIDATAANSGSQRIHSGEGGGADGESVIFGPFTFGAANAQGNGGNSGPVSNVTIKDTVGGANPFEVYAGVPVDQFAGGGKGTSSFFGMQGIGPAAKGGNIGSVTGVTLDAPMSKVIIGKADAAGTASGGLESVGGSGGAISKIAGKVGTLDILAPSGGSTAEGKGGTGGSISKVNLTTVTQFVHLLAAGNGGSGHLAGAGGSVSDIKVAGDIGNVTQTFGLTTADNVMGGLVAGQRGMGGGSAVNGSIAKVSAAKIAAILAGRPDASQLTEANAVTKISAITATAIGAETNLAGSHSEAGGFTFNDNIVAGPNPGNGTFLPGDGDTAIDGLVIVKLGGGGASLPVAPLKLIQV